MTNKYKMLAEVEEAKTKFTTDSAIWRYVMNPDGIVRPFTMPAGAVYLNSKWNKIDEQIEMWFFIPDATIEEEIREFALLITGANGYTGAEGVYLNTFRYNSHSVHHLFEVTKH